MSGAVQSTQMVKVAQTMQAIQAQARPRRLALLAVVIALLALCVFFHLYRLSATPGWDPQEGYNLDIAWNLAHGRLRLFALTSAFGQHPPLFYLLLALSIHLFGYGIVAVRALAALYAILTCVALLLIGWRLVGAGAALWAAAAYIVSPVLLANTRWGYSYAQLGFVGLLCLGAAWRYWQSGERRWLVIAAALAGLATFSDYEGIAWVAFVVLVALWPPRGRWRDAGLAAGVGLGIHALGLLICLMLAPGVFLADVGTTLGRAAGGDPLVQFVTLLLNYEQFLTLDAWLLLGVAGLFLAPARVRGFLFGAVALLALIILKVRDLGLSLHTAVPLLPLLALGAGIALDLALRRLYGWSVTWLGNIAGRRTIIARLLAAIIVFLVVVSPLAMATASDAVALGSTLTTRQDAILGTPADAQATANYIFAHTRDGDLVLASPELAWRFDMPDRAPHTEGADILQTLAQSGQSAAFYPANLPAARWSYDVSLSHARYVVVDNLLRQLSAPDQLPALQSLLHQVEQWPVVFTSGQYTVYERPGAT